MSARILVAFNNNGSAPVELDFRVESADVDDVGHVDRGDGHGFHVVINGIIVKVGVHDCSGPNVRDGHLIPGERARLVRCEQGDRAERLDSLKVLDEHLAGSHPLGRDRKQEGYCCGESFGHEGYQNCDGEGHRRGGATLVDRGDS